MTIPETGTYRFIACGAGYENSMGASVRCDINLKRGKKICFAIGQQGSWECRGGCGATIVAEVEESSKVSQFLDLRVVQTKTIFFFEINVGKSRIRHRTTLKLNF